MEAPILVSRQERLRETQNSDGGWGFFPGKQSWLEPTFYAALALNGEPAADRAWKLVKSWQNRDGGWRPSALVGDSTWVTALAVTLCTVQSDYGRTFEGGMRWLLGTAGAENSSFNRLVKRVFGRGMDRDTSNRGWPWLPDTSAWVEPTTHSLIALKRASRHFHDPQLPIRVREAEALLMSVRSRDGGWNYGSAAALGVDLPSYPETTALALLGLGSQAPPGYHPTGPTNSRLAEAWLSLALGSAWAFHPPLESPPDLMITALEALAAPGGCRELLLPEAG